MNKLILLMFSFSYIFASGDIQFKVKQTNQFAIAKLLIKSPMRGQESAKRSGLKEDYLTTVVVEFNSQILYDFYTSQNMSKNPYFKFRFKNKFDYKKIKFTTIDNSNKEVKQIFTKNDVLAKWEVQNNTIETRQRLIYENPLLNENIRNISNIDEAIQELYGKTKFVYDENLQVNLARYPGNMINIPINIKSNLDLEYISIFHNNHKKPIIAIVKVPSNKAIDFQFRFKMSHGCDINIVVIAKGYDGTVYRQNKLIDVAPDDGNCDGTSNGLGG